MTLSNYLAEANLNPTAFAAQLGCEASTITRIVRGERRPSVDLAVRIEDATGGKVTPRDFAEPSSGEAA